MANIYEITGDWLKLYDMADDPDMDADVWFDTMEAIEGELEVKAENYARLIKQLEADAEGIKKEADRLAARQKTLKNKADWLKKNLEASMQATGKTKFETEHFKFGIQKNPASLKFDEEFAVSNLPLEYLKIVEPEVNKAALKEAIKNGQTFDHVQLVQSESLRIR